MIQQIWGELGWATKQAKKLIKAGNLIQRREEREGTQDGFTYYFHSPGLRVLLRGSLVSGHDVEVKPYI